MIWCDLKGTVYVKKRKLHSIVVRLKEKKNEGTGPWGNEAVISEKQQVMKF